MYVTIMYHADFRNFSLKNSFYVFFKRPEDDKKSVLTKTVFFYSSYLR